jgi:hypothetical protein
MSSVRLGHIEGRGSKKQQRARVLGVDSGCSSMGASQPSALAVVRRFATMLSARKRGFMTLPEGSDKTTAVDKTLLENASKAEVGAAVPRDSADGSEHPPGRTEPPLAESGELSGAARRQPRAGG